MADFYKILSIDGGGIKGIYPATIISAIEEQIGVKIYEYFDLITGTSTGGLIALALAQGKPAKEIKNLYMKKGCKIFKKDLFSYFFGIPRHKYKNNNLKNELINFFGENAILDECKTRVCIPSSNVTNFSTTVFKTRHHPDYEIDYQLPIWQIGMSTTGAPSYFPPFYFNHPLKKGLFVDGGIWANNPTLIGVAEANKLGIKSEQIRVLSIGTGEKKIFKKKKRLQYFGLLGWGSDLVEYVFHVQSLAVVNTIKYLCLDYLRINTGIDKGTKLDNVKCIEDLEALALQNFQDNVTEIKSKFLNSKIIPYSRVNFNL